MRVEASIGRSSGNPENSSDLQLIKWSSNRAVVVKPLLWFLSMMTWNIHSKNNSWFLNGRGFESHRRVCWALFLLLSCFSPYVSFPSMYKYDMKATWIKNNNSLKTISQQVSNPGLDQWQGYHLPKKWIQWLYASQLDQVHCNQVHYDERWSQGSSRYANFNADFTTV